jgi:hypothetical protein
MTRVEDLQDQITHGRTTISEVIKECEEYGIELYEEVLEPIGYNTCDRCGDYGDTEQDFLWVDCFPWDEDNEGDRAIIKAMQAEGVDYCALCWNCVSELKEKGKKL